VNSSTRLADQGRVLEDVADKPFSSLPPIGL